MHDLIIIIYLFGVIIIIQFQNLRMMLGINSKTSLLFIMVCAMCIDRFNFYNNNIINKLITQVKLSSKIAGTAGAASIYLSI